MLKCNGLMFVAFMKGKFIWMCLFWGYQTLGFLAVHGIKFLHKFDLS